MLKLLAYIPVNQKTDINSWLDSNIKAGAYKAGTETFSTAFSDNGGKTTTHYVCCWRLTDGLLESFKTYFNGLEDVGYAVVEESGVDEQLSSWGLQRMETV